jgi:hypothetical protein
MYICVTHVDNLTKIPCYERPMRNGPSFPNLKGLKIEWSDESNWPLLHPDLFPKFYGTCDDDADTDIMGVIQILTKEEYDLQYKAEISQRMPKVVTSRQARLALLQEGLLSNVESAIESIEEPQKTKIKIEWEYATEIYRYSETVDFVANVCNLTSEQIDELFLKASNI